MPKGVREGMIKVSGKDYLPVPFRLLWMRDEKPLWGISTEIIEAAGYTLVRATVTDEAGRTIATAHKACTSGGKFPPIEKAETGAMGRALGAAGFGTQFGELDEEDTGVMGGIADSPVSRTRNNGQVQQRYHADENGEVPNTTPTYPPKPTTLTEAKHQFRLACSAIAPIIGHPQTKVATHAVMVQCLCSFDAPLEDTPEYIDAWDYATNVLRAFHARCPEAQPALLQDAVQTHFQTDLPMVKWPAMFWDEIYTEPIEGTVPV